MRTILAVVVSSIIVIACGFFSKKAVIVLVPSNAVLTEETIELKSTEQMKIIGAMSSVCFVLKSGVPLQEMGVMNRIYADALGGSLIDVHIILSTGARIGLSRPSLSWTADGEVKKGSEELSACAAPRCDTKLPLGAVVSMVEVSAVPALSVGGVYWESERDRTEPLLPSSTTKPSSASGFRTRCAV